MNRRGFLGSLLAAPLASMLPVKPPTIVLPTPVSVPTMTVLSRYSPGVTRWVWSTCATASEVTITVTGEQY